MNLERSVFHFMVSIHFPIVGSLIFGAMFQVSQAAISTTSFSDFQDGTTQGWSGGASPTNIATGGPAGVGDRFLQVGDGGNLATFNTSPAFSGGINLNVTAIVVDMMRPATDSGSLEIRLTLFGPGTSNRWASTTAALVPNNGNWATYTFSLLPPALTQVLGSDSYANLAGNVDRVMLRHDPGAPSSGGASATGTLGIDNIRVIPEPTWAGLGAAASMLILRRRRVDRVSPD